MKIDTNKINRIIAALDQHIEEASQSTPPPWYSFNSDDTMHMNVYGVATCPEGPDLEERNENRNGNEHVVCLTLFQAPRIVGHDSGLWEANARFIQQARTMSPLACQSLKIAIQGLMRDYDPCHDFQGGPADTLEAILDLWPSP